MKVVDLHMLTSTGTKQFLALQCGDCWVNILSRRSWFVLITRAYGTVCATARWLCGILHLALVTVVFHRDANHQACARGMIKCHTALSVFGPLTVNKPLQPHSEQPEIHRATAPPTGHYTKDNNNKVSVQTEPLCTLLLDDIHQKHKVKQQCLEIENCMERLAHVLM